ncbi:hypothetical protein K9F62_11240 [Desulfovibrio sp. JY]|nr:hypothetical protein K9F62_11240 [Desulfovibrio sp. JY]
MTSDTSETGTQTPTTDFPAVDQAAAGNFLPNPMLATDSEAPAAGSDTAAVPETKQEEKKEPFKVIEEQLELFRDPNDTRYATVRIDGVNHNFEIGGKDFNEAISLMFYELTGALPSSTERTQFNEMLRFKARHHGPMLDIYNRFADDNGDIYIDLCHDGQAIHITKDGWDVVKNPPVKFIQHSHMQPLPMPEKGGDFKEILRFLNIKRDEDKILILTWILVVVLTRISRAILILHGAPGACKSSTLSLIRRTLDPSSQILTYAHKTATEAALYLAANAVATFDNLTNLSKDVENILCMAATGGGISKRKLYSDKDSVILQFKRSVILTSLDVPTKASDLLDRAIAIELDRVQGKRLLDDELEREYAAKLPGILGGMCDTLSQMLTLRDKVTVTDLPRMADYALWACAGAMALGYSEEEFRKAYSRAALRVQNDVLQQEGLAKILLDYLDKRGDTSDFVANVWSDLIAHAQQCGFPVDDIPKGASPLSRALKKFIPLLEVMGWKVEFSESKRKGREVSFRKISPPLITPASSEVTEPTAEAVAPLAQPASTEEAKQKSVIGWPEDSVPVTTTLRPMSTTTAESKGWPQPQQVSKGSVNPFLPHIPAGPDSDNTGSEDEGDPYEMGE